MAKMIGKGAMRGLVAGVLADLALKGAAWWFSSTRALPFTPVGFTMLKDHGPDPNPVTAFHIPQANRAGMVWVGDAGATHPHLAGGFHLQSSAWAPVQWNPARRWHNYVEADGTLASSQWYFRANYQNLMWPASAPSLGTGPLPQPVSLPLEIPIIPAWWPSVDPMFIPVNVPGWSNPTPTPWPEIPNVWPGGVPDFGPDGSPAAEPTVDPVVTPFPWADPNVDPWEWAWPGQGGQPWGPWQPAIGWEFSPSATGRPAVNTDPHRNEPPGAGVKERKEKANGRNAAILLGIVNAVTEGVDALEAFHDALPDHLQAKGRNPSPQEMAEALYRNWDAVNFQEAVVNMHESQGEDAFWGWKAGADAAAEGAPHGDLPFGFELGPSDSGGPWVPGMF